MCNYILKQFFGFKICFLKIKKNTSFKFDYFVIIILLIFYYFIFIYCQLFNYMRYYYYAD